MRRSQIMQHTIDSGLDTYRYKLTAVLERLTSGRRNAEFIAAEPVSESAVWESNAELALFCKRNLAANRSDWTGFLIRQVLEALQRVDNGSYGFCRQCGQPIAQKRLAALPWAALCITCQEVKAEIRVM